MGFADVELPSERAGLLTRIGTLSAQSRPEAASVVQRGLWVDTLIACDIPEPFPDLIATPTGLPPSASEKAEWRMTTSPCRDCHVSFDPYGLALEQFDAIGRFRTTDVLGRDIDAAVDLPSKVGGGHVNGGAELSAALAGETFVACLTSRFLQYAVLPWGERAEQQLCKARELVRTGKLPARATFAEILTQVTLSEAFVTRKR